MFGSYQCYCRRGYQLSDIDGLTCEGKDAESSVLVAGDIYCTSLFLISCCPSCLRHRWVRPSHRRPYLFLSLSQHAGQLPLFLSRQRLHLGLKWSQLSGYGDLVGTSHSSTLTDFGERSCILMFFFKNSFADVDECLTGTHTCAENQSCFNIQGGFRCLSFECPNNYRRVGETWVPWSRLFCTRVPGTLGRPDASCTHQILSEQSCSFSQPESDQSRDFKIWPAWVIRVVRGFACPVCSMLE